MGPGEERLDDHGVRAGGEVRLRPGSSVGRGGRRDGLFPARGASELEPSEAALYRMLRERLPETTIVSIGHRSTLHALHDRRIEMRAGADGRFVPTPVAG